MSITRKLLEINGVNYTFTCHFTIDSLLRYLGFNTKLIVIDYNGTILQTELWSDTELKNYDKLEILTVAGGG